MHDAGEPLSIREVLARVESSLQRAVSFETVNSSLSIVPRDPLGPVVRRSRGVYEAVRL